MSHVSLELEAEHARMHIALDEFAKYWRKPEMTLATSDLASAIAHAERALATFAEQEAQHPKAFMVRVSGLRSLIILGHAELERARQFALEEIGRRMAHENTKIHGFDTVCPQGTILSCPSCGAGLYKITMSVTTADVVLDDGMILTPLNTMIPKRDVWKPLACPFCRARCYQNGQLHTVQDGWK